MWSCTYSDPRCVSSTISSDCGRRTRPSRLSELRSRCESARAHGNVPARVTRAVIDLTHFAHDPPKCGRFGDRIMRPPKIGRDRTQNRLPLLLIAPVKPVSTLPENALNAPRRHCNRPAEAGPGAGTG